MFGSMIFIVQLHLLQQGAEDIIGLMQDCSNSTANALELLQSCTKPVIYFSQNWWQNQMLFQPIFFAIWHKIIVIRYPWQIKMNIKSLWSNQPFMPHCGRLCVLSFKALPFHTNRYLLGMGKSRDATLLHQGIAASSYCCIKLLLLHQGTACCRYWYFSLSDCVCIFICTFFEAVTWIQTQVVHITELN